MKTSVLKFDTSNRDRPSRAPKGEGKGVGGGGVEGAREKGGVVEWGRGIGAGELAAP